MFPNAKSIVFSAPTQTKISWWNIGGQSSAAVKCLHGNFQDVGSNPAAARNKNLTLRTPLQEVARGSGQDLSGRPAM